VATATNEKVGDGTSTATILTQAIFEGGMQYLTSDVNAIALKNGIMTAAKIAVEELKKMATPIERREEITQIATMSSESSEMGRIIADAIEKIGKDGTITVEESQMIGITSEIVNGMKIDKGYISSYMATDQDKMTAEYTNIPVLLTNRKIVSAMAVVPLLEKIVKEGKNELLIICEGVEGDALSTFILNKLKGTFKIIAVQAPGFGNHKMEVLRDIAVMTGATVIAEETGMTFEKAEFDMLGFADKVVVSKESEEEC
jgi:chaperonin GroEL